MLSPNTDWGECLWEVHNGSLRVTMSKLVYPKMVKSLDITEASRLNQDQGRAREYPLSKRGVYRSRGKVDLIGSVGDHQVKGWVEL
jgi:hypothetical protein